MVEISMPATDLANRPLLGSLLALLADARPGFGQARVFARAEALVLGQLLTLGRHTITQSLLTLGLVDDDWSAFYRLLSAPRLEMAQLRRRLFAQTLAHTLPSQPYVVAVDGVQVPRPRPHDAGDELAQGPPHPGLEAWHPPCPALCRPGLVDA